MPVSSPHRAEIGRGTFFILHSPKDKTNIARKFNSQNETSVLDIPMLPSDLGTPAFAPPNAADDFPPIEDAIPTEMADSATEPRSEPAAMPPITLLDVLRHKAESEKLEIETAWTSIVQKLATDSATEAEVTAALKLSGRSLGELETAVSHAKKIIRLELLVADQADADAATREARTAFNELKALQKEQVKQMEHDFKAARSALHKASRRAERCQSAWHELNRLCPPPVVPPPLEPTQDYEVSARNYNAMVATHQQPISVAQPS